MTYWNQSITSEFLLLGLPIQSEHQNLFYALFLAMYLNTILSNLLIIFLICLDSHFHTPMYLFLSNFSFSDLLVLTKFHDLLHTLLVVRLSFCSEIVIPHFFCEISALLKLACSNTHVNELVIFIMGGPIVVTPFLLIFVSYVYIFSFALKVPSSHVTHKAFSTCGSHHVVSLFSGTIIGLSICPSDNSTVKDTLMALMYTVVTPMLSPFIYRLRKEALRSP